MSVVTQRERFWKVLSSYEVVREYGFADRNPYMRVYTIIPVGGREKNQTTVEFDWDGVRACKSSAWLALRSYLERRERPPSRLIVRPDRTITELEE
jgi:hypothetical protein